MIASKFCLVYLQIPVGEFLLGGCGGDWGDGVGGFSLVDGAVGLR